MKILITNTINTENQFYDPIRVTINRCKLLPMVTLIFLSLLFTQNAIGQCGDDLQCLPDLTNGNGPDPCDAKLYCSNSGSTLDGIIDCTQAADTDGCGIDTQTEVDNFTDVSLFVDQGVEEECYIDPKTNKPYDYVQWIKFATPEKINSAKIQGVSQLKAWAVFYAGTTTESDMISYNECDDLTYVEGACSDQNQWKRWINPYAVIADGVINVYYIALFYTEANKANGGDINFKTKDCENIDVCVPEVSCPDDDLAFCEGTIDLATITDWLGLFENTDCGNKLEWTLDGVAFTPEDIVDLTAGTYTITNSLLDGVVVVESCTAGIIVTAPPMADDPADVVACDIYTLPDLSVGNVYRTAANGGGTIVGAGTTITTTTTLYVYAAGIDPCDADENELVVTITDSPVADDPMDVDACDSYTLPGLSAGNVYRTAANGGGTVVGAGTAITMTTTLYVYAAGTDPCEADENELVITIIDSPEADDPADVVACDSYTLPGLSAGNVYRTAANGGGTVVGAGTAITMTTTLYVYAAGTDPCEADENELVITIIDSPEADDPADVVACDNYTLPGLSAGNVYRTAANGGGTVVGAGTAITMTTTLYIYAAATAPCTADENQLNITIFDSPTASLDAPTEVCENQAVTFTATPSGASTYIFFTDDNGDGMLDPDDTVLQSGAGDSYMIVSAVEGTTTVHVKVIISNDCYDIDSATVEVLDCCDDETAFAFLDGTSQCFIERGKGRKGRGGRWGWTNNIGSAEDNDPNNFSLIYGNGNACKTPTETNGEYTNLAGTVTTSFSPVSDADGNIIDYNLTVTYTLLDPDDGCNYFELGTVHIYVGHEMLPDKLAPGQYGTSVSDNGNDDSNNTDNVISVTIGLSEVVNEFDSGDNLYFIAHAEVEVCSCIPPSAFISDDIDLLNVYKATEVYKTNKPGLTDIEDQTSSIIGLRAYPNPSIDFINIEVDGLGEGATELRITDYLGRELYKEVEVLRRTTLIKKIDFNGNFLPGVYYISIRNNGNTKVMPVAIMK